MARNGSGTYSNPYPNFISGTVISSSEVDANNSDIATALTQSIAVDGQSVVTGDIPLATHKFTAMKVGTASTDSLSLGQAQAEAFVWCGTAGGGADAITLSPSPAITAYAAGQRFVWMASGSTNTTATTVAISGLTAIALQDNGAALTAGQHAAGKMFMGILNTTSTVQIMQVQVSGTDPLIISSLTVDGNSQFNGTIITGVNDTGYDVKFFGATSGAYMLWDESDDDLKLVGAAGLNVAGSSVLASVDVTAVATAATFEPDGDTSAGDNAALGYTSVLGAILTGQGSTNDVTLVNDADATVLGIPTGTTNVEMAGTLAVTGGITGVASINSGQIGGRRNYIYNGDMQICQRSTSVSGIGDGDTGYHVQDRWMISEGGSVQSISTMSQSTESPDGFYSSLKLDCTTAESAVAAGEWWFLSQRFEGQDLQGWNKGDAQAKSVTLSFWVNATKTGTYIIMLYDANNTRHISQSYTVDVTNTWEKKTLTFAGDTSGAFTNNNARSLDVWWFLMAGSDMTSGTLATSWASYTAANNAVGQVNTFDNTDNNFHLTGVELELGDTATAFEHRTFGEELQQCQRYFCRTYGYGTATGTATNNGSIASTSQAVSTYASAGTFQFPVEMRAAPTITMYSTQNADTTGKVTSDTTDGTGQAIFIAPNSVFLVRNNDNSGVGNNNFIKAHAVATADL